jgi:hypothetical protein
VAFKLDTSKFKKIGGDKHHTVLKHVDGHELRIAHASLSPKLRGQIAEIPSVKHFYDGGVAVGSEKDTNAYDKGATESWSSAPLEQPKPKPAPSSNSGFGGPTQGRAPKQAPPTEFAQGGKVKMYAEGTPDAPVAANDSAPSEDQQIADIAAAHQAPTQQTGQPLQVEAIPGAEPSAPAPEAAAPAPSGQPSAPTSPNDPYGVNTTQAAQETGLNQQISGIKTKAAAENAMYDRQNSAYQHAQNQEAVLKITHQEKTQELDQHVADLQHAIDTNKINPTRYIDNMTTGQKIRSVIGMILSGAGSGVTGQENMASKYLDAQINRDIDSQKANLGKQQNLLGSYMKQYGNINDATNMTRVAINTMLVDQLHKAAAASGSQLSAGAALQEIGVLNFNSAQLRGSTAMRRTLLSPEAGNIVPDEMKIKAFITDPAQQERTMKSLKEAQDTESFSAQAIHAFDRIAQLNTVGNRIMHVGFVPPEVEALEKPLLAAMSKNEAGRYTESDAKALSNLFRSPFNGTNTIGTKREELIKTLNNKRHYPDLAAVPGLSINRASSSGTGITESAPKPKK